jgi:hypothetical protein
MRYVAVLAYLFSIAGAHAQAVSGDTMQELCSSDDEKTKTICIGYVRGFMDGSVYQATVTKQKTFYCVKDPSVTYPGLAEIFRKWLDAHPSELSKPGGVLLANTMKESFPCK